MSELWLQHRDIKLHYSVLLGIEEFFGMRRGLDQHSDVLLDLTLCVGSALSFPVGCNVLNDLYPSQIIRWNSSRSVT